MRLQRGFTLLELLVAIGVLAVIAVVALNGLTSVLETRDRLESDRESQRTLVMTLLRLEDDLSQVIPRTIRDSSGRRIHAFVGGTVGSRLAGDPDIEFTRGGMAITDTSRSISDMRRIGYKVDEEGKLLRYSWTVLDRSPVTNPDYIVLLENVEELSARYYGANQKWTQTWPNVGDEANIHELPKGIELTLKIRDLPIIKRLFVVGN